MSGGYLSGGYLSGGICPRILFCQTTALIFSNKTTATWRSFYKDTADFCFQSETSSFEAKYSYKVRRAHQVMLNHISVTKAEHYHFPLPWKSANARHSFFSETTFSVLEKKN